MPLSAGTHGIGRDGGAVQVRTYREGVAQKIGHDLIIDVGRWDASVEVGVHGEPTAVALDADARSLSVREGLRGAKALTDKDRAQIVETIDQKILGGHPISFRSSRVERRGDRLTVAGELTIAGMARPVTFELQLTEDGRISATLPITQSEWGIKPYRGLMGALKVRDTVEVVVDVRLPTT